MAQGDAVIARRRFGEELYAMRKSSGLSLSELQGRAAILSDQLSRWEEGLEMPEPHDLTTVLREMDLGPARNRTLRTLYELAKGLTDRDDREEAFRYLDSAPTALDSRRPSTGRGQPSSRAPDRRTVDSRTRTPTGQPPSSKIFLNYRRDDTAGFAGRLYDRLAAKFGVGRIFIDIDAIELGEDFSKVITDAIGQSDVMLVLIGGNWLNASDSSGRRRLDNPSDYVAMEVATALERGIRVIPVLIDGAVMPRAKDLPPSLAGLARRNAAVIKSASFGSDVLSLMNVLERLLD